MILSIIQIFLMKVMINFETMFTIKTDFWQRQYKGWNRGR